MSLIVGSSGRRRSSSQWSRSASRSSFPRSATHSPRCSSAWAFSHAELSDIRSTDPEVVGNAPSYGEQGAEGVGRVMELRKSLVAGPTVSVHRQGSSGPDIMARKGRPAGVEEHGTVTKGCPGTWEILPLPRSTATGAAARASWLAGVVLHARRMRPPVVSVSTNARLLPVLVLDGMVNLPLERARHRRGPPHRLRPEPLRPHATPAGLPRSRHAAHAGLLQGRAGRGQHDHPGHCGRSVQGDAGQRGEAPARPRREDAHGAQRPRRDRVLRALRRARAGRRHPARDGAPVHRRALPRAARG